MIVFVDYLYKGIGGVGQLVVNSVLGLNKRGLSAKVYCSRDSYEYEQLVNCGAKFVFICSDDVPIYFLSDYLCFNDVILLTHINNTPLLEQVKNKGIRILFYSVHPDTFFVYNRYMSLFLQKKAALYLVSKLLLKRALVFMDIPNVNGINRKGGRLDLDRMQYLPIPIQDCECVKTRKDLDSCFNITYIGRSNADWKIYPIVKVIKDMQGTNQLVRFIIITDNTDSFDFMIKKYVPENHFEIEYQTGLCGESLKKYLIEKSDLHISMGTSALEGARLGIPTILIDYSYHVFPDDYLYRWIFECKGFCLAEDITKKTNFEGRRINTVMNMLRNEDKKNEIASLCYDYVCKNHSIDAYIEKLLFYCENTTMTVEDYCSTRFSYNMKWINPLIIRLSRFKRYIVHQKA